MVLDHGIEEGKTIKEEGDHLAKDHPNYWISDIVLDLKYWWLGYGADLDLKEGGTWAQEKDKFSWWVKILRLE